MVIANMTPVATATTRQSRGWTARIGDNFANDMTVAGAARRLIAATIAAATSMLKLPDTSSKAGSGKRHASPNASHDPARYRSAATSRATIPMYMSSIGSHDTAANITTNGGAYQMVSFRSGWIA